MAFATEYLADPSKVGSGERYAQNQTVLTARTFENGLKIGLFAKLDAGSIDNMDGSATPTIAGVVLRNPAAPVEANGTVDGDVYSQWEYCREGLVTVEVKAGENPVQFGDVFASNAGDADDGKAITAAGIATNAEFIEEVKANVWLIRLK